MRKVGVIAMCVMLCLLACKKESANDRINALAGSYVCSCYHTKTVLEPYYENDSLREDTFIYTTTYDTMVVVSEVTKNPDEDRSIHVSRPATTVKLAAICLCADAPSPSREGPHISVSFTGDSMYCSSVTLLPAFYHPYDTYETSIYHCKKANK
jgi:hypothetical protein